MTHGALFNGIAGFPLAAEWAGIETKWTVEIDEFCNKVSKKHFPNATQYQDIHKAANLPYVDIISGGFPCQPFSVAGKQLGNQDDRALWPQMLRIIKEVKPAYVIGENVAGIINLALDEVLTSLEAEGYTTETFIVPACAVNAPHRRDRFWIIAYAANAGRYRGSSTSYGEKQNKAIGPNLHVSTERLGPFRISTHPECVGQSGQRSPPQSCNTAEDRVRETGRFDNDGFRLSESPVCGPNDGLYTGLVRNRRKQLKAYGNAIVPQVAFEFFKCIVELDSA